MFNKILTKAPEYAQKMYQPARRAFSQGIKPPNVNNAGANFLGMAGLTLGLGGIGYLMWQGSAMRKN